MIKVCFNIHSKTLYSNAQVWQGPGICEINSMNVWESDLGASLRSKLGQATSWYSHPGWHQFWAHRARLNVDSLWVQNPGERLGGYDLTFIMLLTLQGESGPAGLMGAPGPKGEKGDTVSKMLLFYFERACGWYMRPRAPPRIPVWSHWLPGVGQRLGKYRRWVHPSHGRKHLSFSPGRATCWTMP